MSTFTINVNGQPYVVHDTENIMAPVFHALEQERAAMIKENNDLKAKVSRLEHSAENVIDMARAAALQEALHTIDRLCVASGKRGDAQEVIRAYSVAADAIEQLSKPKEHVCSGCPDCRQMPKVEPQHCKHCGWWLREVSGKLICVNEMCHKPKDQPVTWKELAEIAEESCHDVELRRCGEDAVVSHQLNPEKFVQLLKNKVRD